jgi:anti-anti-sigma factor
MFSDLAVFSASAASAAGGRSGCRVVVEGEVDMVSAPELARCVARAVADTPGDLVLDLAGTTFLDSAGLKVIASAQRCLDEPGEMILWGPNPFIRRVLAIADMGAICRIED